MCDVGSWNCFGELGIHLRDSSWRHRRSFVHQKFTDYCWRWIQHRRVKQSLTIGKSRCLPGAYTACAGSDVTCATSVKQAEYVARPAQRTAAFSNSNPRPTGESSRRSSPRSMRTPLVSILTPAYNADRWIAETIRSAVAQTWKRKEIIVVDDGSTDQTLAISRRFESALVRVVSQKNQGAAAARNHALQMSQGDYVQWLDADDILSPDKIERQLAVLSESDSRRVLLSSPWAPFYYRTRHARFVPNSVWQDLSPVEWLLKKMAENLWMQTSTWLTSRELAEAAGPWDTRLYYDDDGEYFCRVLLASEGTRFVPEAKTFYRVTPFSIRVSNIGASDRKKDSMLLSMKLHIQYLRSLEDSARVRKACLAYLQNWYETFYPERMDIVAELQALALQLEGRLEEPCLRWKYAWMEPVFGWKAAKWAQRAVPQLKTSFIRHCDKVIYLLEADQAAASQRVGPS